MLEKTETIVRVLLYEMKDCAVPSRNNETSGEPVQVFNIAVDHNSVMNALLVFASQPNRHKLVFETSSGREIDFFPVLAGDSPALTEPGYDLRARPRWEMAVGVRPR